MGWPDTALYVQYCTCISYPYMYTFKSLGQQPTFGNKKSGYFHFALHVTTPPPSPSPNTKAFHQTWQVHWTLKTWEAEVLIMHCIHKLSIHMVRIHKGNFYSICIKRPKNTDLYLKYRYYFKKQELSQTEI